jgi:hypothetical protein
MGGIREITDFRTGKQTRKGEPTPTEPQRVTVVPAAEADEFFRTRNQRERAEHVRGLQALGLLHHHDPHKFTCRVRTGEVNEKGWPVKERAYVFNCAVEDIPRRRRARRPRQRITTW